MNPTCLSDGSKKGREQIPELEESGEFRQIEELRHCCEEFQDYDYIHGNVNTIRVRSLSLLSNTDTRKKRKQEVSEERIFPNLEGCSSNQAISSTFIDQSCPPLELQLSPITDECRCHFINDTSTEKLRNPSNSASTEWLTIEQWKIIEHSIINELKTVEPEDENVILSENKKITKESYTEQIIQESPDCKDKHINKIAHKELTLDDGSKACSIDGWKEMEEMAFRKNSKDEKTPLILLKSKERNLKVTEISTSENKSNKYVCETGYKNTEEINKALHDKSPKMAKDSSEGNDYEQREQEYIHKDNEEIQNDDIFNSEPTLSTEDSSVDDLEKIKVYSPVHRYKLFADFYNECKYKSSCQNGSQIKDAMYTMLKQGNEGSSEDDLENIQFHKERETFEKHSTSFDGSLLNHKKGLNVILPEQNIVTDQEASIIGKENLSKNISTQEICFLENLSPKFFSSNKKIQVPNAQQSRDPLTDGIEPDFL